MGRRDRNHAAKDHQLMQPMVVSQVVKKTKYLISLSETLSCSCEQLEYKPRIRMKPIRNRN